MRFYLGLLACVLANMTTIGQSNMMKAVVINNNGDSIYGNIDYRNWKNNPQTINFINDANEKKVFDPSLIGGFYIPGVSETYTSFDVEIDPITSDQDEAIKNVYADTSVIKKRVFLLQLIIHPQMRLYEFTSDRKDHFYYKKRDENPVELVHHYLFDDLSSRVQEVTTYQEQLSLLFASCPAVAERAVRIKFSKKEIQDIFLKYLQCTDPGSAVEVKKKDAVTFTFGIIGGAMWNTFKFEGESDFSDPNYSSSLSPLFGASFDIGLSRNQNKLHFLNELIYKSYKTNSSFKRPYGAGYTSNIDVHFNFSYLQLNTLFRYVLRSKGFIKPFINIGISNAFMISENANTIHASYSYGQEDNAKAIEGPAKYEFSPLGGAGIKIRKTEAELRYGANQKGFSPFLTLNTNPVSFQFIFTYQL